MSKKTKTIIALNILLFVFSLGNVFSKLASNQDFLSIRFILCYTALLFIMFVYAIGWQQIIKRLDLTTAYANRAITVVFGILWGVVVFNEKITIGKVIGAIIVIAGVLLYVTDKEGNNE
ncbi:MAG: EamA family transporter [Lachnospiraceae bacterium]|nr:EamA family transporter [Lachnospiraceae bacterium]